MKWPRAILLADLNAFFASIEQRDFPELRRKPVAVTNGVEGSCIITCSYEARAFGVKTGMRFYEAQRLCPGLIKRPSRPEVYAEVSAGIMEALEAVTPDIEIFSIDEAFMDVTACQSLHGSPFHMAQMTKDIILKTSGLRCSVGVSGDKTTAKFAASLQKPDGLVVIPPWESKERLRNVPVTALCGIAEGIGQFLASHGVYHCGDMEKLPISVLAKRFGNLGRRIWLMCQGLDPEAVVPGERAPKSIGHGKVLPPRMRCQQTIWNYFLHMSEKVAYRLRQHDLMAKRYYIGFCDETGWYGGKYHLVAPNNDGLQIFRLCRYMLEQYWQGQVIRQIQVTALELTASDQQTDLFLPRDVQREKLNETMDTLNERFGKGTVKPGNLIAHKPMPDVIAPAWRPKGVRRSV